MINFCEDRCSNISIDDNVFGTEITLNSEVPGIHNTISSIEENVYLCAMAMCKVLYRKGKSARTIVIKLKKIKRYIYT
jgi:hypothetical protein